jgi:hypothetical protein
MNSTLEASDACDEILHLRRDLRSLVLLEAVQMATGIGALLAIATHAAVVASDIRIAVSIAAVVLLALSYLLLGLRVRVGQELLRRELQTVEQRHEPAQEVGHPYRSSASGLQHEDVQPHVGLPCCRLLRCSSARRHLARWIQ